MNDFNVEGQYLSGYSYSSTGVDYANYKSEEEKIKDQKIKLSVGYQFKF